MLRYFAKHSKQRKTTKVIKIQWIASIWRQNDQNVELRCKTFKTNLNYKSDQNPMTCIDWMSKRSKQRYTTKVIKIQWLASIWRQNDQNVELRRKTFKTKLNYKSDPNYNELHRFDVKAIKTFKTKQNYKSNQITINLHRFDVKTIKMLRYFAKHSKQRKTTKLIKLQWIASIWRQNDQNVGLRRETFKTKLNYKSDQNPMTCIDLTSKRSKCWVTSQNIQNKAKLQKWSKSNDLHRLDVKTIKTKLNYKSDQNPMTCIDSMSKRFKTTQNYKTDQITMNCIDLTSKRSKCWVTSQNSQNKAKLQKWSKSNDLHRFDVKTIKMLSYVAEHSKQT